MWGRQVLQFVRKVAIGLIPSLFVVAPGLAVAQQTTSPLPTRDELDPLGTPAAPPPVKLEVEGDIEHAPCALADPAYADIRITLRDATFNNLGPENASVLAPAYAPYLGVERPISVICDIRDAAATILRRKGYLAAVQVPVQRIENGSVKFEILYAKLTAVRVLGNAGANEALLGRYLSHVAQGQVFNRFDAERYLLLARDIPGQDVRLTLKPAGTGAGDMIGEVAIRRRPVEADLSVQNLASRDTGPWGGQVRAQFNGLTGLGDRTIASFYSTSDFSEQQVAQIGHDMLIGGQGLRIGARFTYAWTRPTLSAGTPPVRARTLFANVEASYPFVLTQGLTLRSAAGFDFVNQKVRFDNLPLSEDRLRVGYIRLDSNAVDMRGIGPRGVAGWRIAGALEVRRGFSIWHASPNCLAQPARCAGANVAPPSLPDGDPTATVLRFSGIADLHVARNLTVSVAPRAQTSSGPVLAFEQFTTGNYTVGRGYEPGTLVGDRGVGFQTEVRIDNFRLSSKAQLAAQPYVFADNAWVWNKGASAAVNPQRVSSLGGGLRLNWRSRARLDVALAVPTRTVGRIQRGDARFLVTLTTNILPWRTR
jgi:hemolysin activation/secretion protein